MIQPLLVFSDWGLLVLRVVLGVILLAHGIPKMKNFRATAEWMGTTFKPGLFWAFVVSIVEVFGGLFLIVGFLTQLVAIFVALQFLVIIFKVNWSKGLKGGYEFDLIILASALLLLTLGGGVFSIDSSFGVYLY